jgi:hypothetical protein
MSGKRGIGGSVACGTPSIQYSVMQRPIRAYCMKRRENLPQVEWENQELSVGEIIRQCHTNFPHPERPPDHG